MANNKLIMAWSKCKIDLAPMPENESMAADSSMFNVGIIRNNTTELTADEGDALQAIETGGAIVAEERQEGAFSLATEIIEPSDDLYVSLGLGRKSGEDLLVDTHVATGYFSLKLTPKNIGAKGIKIPKCSVSVAPAFGDDTGHALTLNVSILKGDAGYWYSKFAFKGDLQVNSNTVSLAATDSSASPTESITVTTNEDTVTAQSNASWCVTQVGGKSVKIGAQANSGEQRTATVIITAGDKKAAITVTQSASE